MLGPWTALGNPSHSETTLGTQGSSILPLATTSPASGNQRAIYVGDRYEPYITGKEGSRSIWLPMEITPAGGLLLINASKWSLDDWPDVASEEAHVWRWGV